MLLRESFPLDLELESVVKPSGIDVLVDDPVLFAIDLDQGWRWVHMLGDCIWFCFREDVDMEDIINFPVQW